MKEPRGQLGVCGGWRASPSSPVWSPLLLGGKVPTLSSLAARWRVANHSRGPGRPGKVEAPWRPSRAGWAGSSPPPPLLGGILSPEPLSHGGAAPGWFCFMKGEKGFLLQALLKDKNS